MDMGDEFGKGEKVGDSTTLLLLDFKWKMICIV
jgi:hypothetical protein